MWKLIRERHTLIVLANQTNFSFMLVHPMADIAQRTKLICFKLIRFDVFKPQMVCMLIGWIEYIWKENV
jgi:hypothetical protein